VKLKQPAAEIHRVIALGIVHAMASRHSGLAPTEDDVDAIVAALNFSRTRGLLEASEALMDLVAQQPTLARLIAKEPIAGPDGKKGPPDKG
jgi:hypothetical protein